MDDFLGLDEIDPAEPADVHSHLLVVLVVDYPGNPSHDLVILVNGQPVLAFADLERPVLAGGEGVDFHRLYLGDIVPVVRVQLVGKTDESFKTLPVSNFL